MCVYAVYGMNKHDVPLYGILFVPCLTVKFIIVLNLTETSALRAPGSRIATANSKSYPSIKILFSAPGRPTHLSMSSHGMVISLICILTSNSCSCRLFRLFDSFKSRTSFSTRSFGRSFVCPSVHLLITLM